MSQDTPDRPILIVSDEADEVRTVRDLLQQDCPKLFGADNEEAGLRLFAEREPALLVLAFQELERSERFYLMLYRQCPTIQEIQHQTLLLCKSNEAEAAFSLCRNGTLDDYLVNRPMHDPLRLRLAVQQALARLTGRSQSTAVNRQLSNIGSDLRHLDSFVGKALTGGQARQAEALNAFREFAGRLSQELDRLEASKVEGKLQQAQQWVQQFGEDYREQAERVGSHGFPPATPEVMLVDDDDVYRDMLGAMLEEVEVRVSLADGGEAALAEMRKRRPDIVLLDYNMPGLDGMATLKQMKGDPELRQIPVVMLTGVNDRETVKAVITGGAAGYIVKPSNRPTILAKIRNLLPKPPENAKWG